MKINPKLERSNCKTLEFQESPTILQYYPAEQIVAGHQLDHEIKFLLVSVLFLISRLIDIIPQENKPKKALYHPYPGIFAYITTHDLLILDPQLPGLCPERRGTCVITSPT